MRKVHLTWKTIQNAHQLHMSHGIYIEKVMGHVKYNIVQLTGSAPCSDTSGNMSMCLLKSELHLYIYITLDSTLAVTGVNNIG